MTEETRTFRLKDGAKHVGLQPGQTIELTVTQAEAFGDKFELVTKKTGNADKKSAPVPSPYPPTHPIRQDVGANTSVEKEVAVAAFSGKEQDKVGGTIAQKKKAVGGDEALQSESGPVGAGSEAASGATVAHEGEGKKGSKKSKKAKSE